MNNQKNMSWGDLVAKNTRLYGAFVLGIDPVWDDIPNCFKQTNTSPIQTLTNYVEFLLETTDGKIGFIKPQSAFFEAFGSDGVAVLAKLIRLAKERGHGVILDAKRGDIGSTSAAYANAYLKSGSTDLEVNALTINPFLGPETLEPFIDMAKEYGKGLFILVKTSNPGSGWLQDKVIEKQTVSEHIARLVDKGGRDAIDNSGLSPIGAVVGATYPEEAKQLRALMPNSIFLAPGLGAQGGKADDLVPLYRPDRTGVVVPSSRGITKINDLSIPQDEYAKLIQTRVNDIQTNLKNS